MTGVSGMVKNKDRINRRLTAIKTTSAAQWGAPEPPRPSRDKRAEERRTVYRFARLMLYDRTVMNCIVKSASPRGARVVIEGAVTLPHRVILKIDQAGESRRARVAWQKGREVGLHFVDKSGAAPA